MTRKILSIVGVVLIICAFQSCSPSPEQNLLKRYFHAISLNDAQTMATMSLEPLMIEAESWEITNVSEELEVAATLPELNTTELELKKNLEDSVATTLNASDELDNAKFEHENARTGSARRAAMNKVNELQTKYDEIYAAHKDLQKQYNEAKAASTKEEEVTSFSIGAGDLPTIREMQGTMYAKEVDVKCTTSDGSARNYKVFMRRYVLEDELTNLTRRGRWIITNFDTPND
ncbi:hypothetical protein ACFLT9_07190 [Acidobacteriota bacterium]